MKPTPFLQDRDELAGILNAGYRKGNAYVVRVSDSKARRAHGRTSYTSPHSPSLQGAEVAEWTQEP